MDQKALKRIRKLLALTEARGATKAEATSAARKAAELMAKHGIAFAQPQPKPQPKPRPQPEPRPPRPQSDRWPPEFWVWHNGKWCFDHMRPWPWGWKPKPQPKPRPQKPSGHPSEDKYWKWQEGRTLKAGVWEDGWWGFDRAQWQADQAEKRRNAQPKAQPKRMVWGERGVLILYLAGLLYFIVPGLFTRVGSLLMSSLLIITSILSMPPVFIALFAMFAVFVAFDQMKMKRGMR